jgi:thioredoxin-related protein
MQMEMYMNKVTILVMTLAVLFMVPSCSKSSEKEGEKPAGLKGEDIKITWHSFNEGLKLASGKKKHIVMDFYADWCGWCRKMEAEVFSDPEVAAKLRDNYVCIRIHTDRDYNETIKYKNHVLTKQEFSMMLGVQGLPTVVFLDGQGNLITKIPGYINKDTFLPLLNYIREECYLKKVPFQDYMDGKAPCGKK